MCPWFKNKFEMQNVLIDLDIQHIKVMYLTNKLYINDDFCAFVTKISAPIQLQLDTIHD